MFNVEQHSRDAEIMDGNEFLKAAVVEKPCRGLRCCDRGRRQTGNTERSWEAAGRSEIQLLAVVAQHSAF